MRPLLLLALGACSGGGDAPAKDDDTAADTDADTDTDTDVDTDTKDTSDTDPDTDPVDDTGPPPDDTGAPPPVADSGYYGPTRLVALVDGASGSGTEPSAIVIYDPVAGTSTTVSGLTVRADSLVDCAGDSIFVLESRGGDGGTDRVVRVSPEAGTYTEWELGSNFQPRDIAAVADTFWVAAWGKPRLLTFAADGTPGAFVNLADHADSDGIPEANGLLYAAPLVYATVARQSQSDGSYAGALLLEIDADLKAVTRTATLSGRYPSGELAMAGDSIYVHLRSTPGAAGALNADGGLETVARTDFTPAGLTVDDSTTGITQSAATLDPFTLTAWFATVSAEGAPNAQAYSLFDGNALQMWPLGSSVTGIGVVSDTVWVAENPFDGGDGAIVGHTAADGTEETRLSQGGRVRALATCVTSSAPVQGGGDSGG